MACKYTQVCKCIKHCVVDPKKPVLQAQNIYIRNLKFIVNAYLYLFLCNTYVRVYLLISLHYIHQRGLTFGLSKMLVRFPQCQPATRWDCDPLPEKLDFGAFEHDLSVAKSICLMFSCQVWPVSVISPTLLGGRLCLEPSLSPSWKVESKGRCFWVRGWMGREAAALVLLPDCSVGGKGGPDTPLVPLDILF